MSLVLSATLAVQVDCPLLGDGDREGGVVDLRVVHEALRPGHSDASAGAGVDAGVGGSARPEQRYLGSGGDVWQLP